MPLHTKTVPIPTESTDACNSRSGRIGPVIAFSTPKLAVRQEYKMNGAWDGAMLSKAAIKANGYGAREHVK